MLYTMSMNLFLSLYSLFFCASSFFLIGIALYTVKCIIERLNVRDSRASYIISLIISICFIILYFPLHNYLIPLRIWYIINFLGSIFALSVILLHSSTKKTLKVVDNSIYYKFHGEDNIQVSDNKMIIFSKQEFFIIYILSFITIIVLLYFTYYLILISHEFSNTVHIFYYSKHYVNSIRSTFFLGARILFCSFTVLLYFNVKGFLVGCINNVNKNFYIFTPFILYNIFFVMLYFPNGYIMPFTGFGWQLLHILGISCLILMLYAFHHGFKKSTSLTNINYKVIFSSKREQRYILICTSIVSIVSMFYVISHIIKILAGIKHVFDFSQPLTIASLPWTASFLSIIILVYFNIKALSQESDVPIRVKIYINLFITIFYLIFYIPLNIFPFGDVSLMCIEITSCFFFFYLFYFFLLIKHGNIRIDKAL